MNNLDQFIITCESNIIDTDSIVTEGLIGITTAAVLLLGASATIAMSSNKNVKGEHNLTIGDISRILNNKKVKEYKIATEYKHYVDSIKSSTTKYITAGKEYINAADKLTKLYQSTGFADKLNTSEDAESASRIFKELPSSIITARNDMLDKANKFSNVVESIISSTKLSVENINYRESDKEECLAFIKAINPVLEIYDDVDFYEENPDDAYTSDPLFVKACKLALNANNKYWKLYSQVLNLVKVKI